MRLKLTITAAAAGIFFASAAFAQDIKIALIAGKTGPLEAYAKQTEAGFMMGLEYLTKGTMAVSGRKINVIVKDDQLKADLAKTLLEQAYNDDEVDLAVGTTSSAAALAMLPVAEENGKVLIVEPAVADAITGEKWNRFIFRTARNSTQDAYGAAAAVPASGEVSIATLAQDYAFGKRRRCRAQERARRRSVRTRRWCSRNTRRRTPPTSPRPRSASSTRSRTSRARRSSTSSGPASIRCRRSPT